MSEAAQDDHGIAALQRQFAEALMRVGDPPPAFVNGATDAARLKRFNVYRNNVHASLAGALAARFPVVERLVGDEFFRAMALIFVERHPPTSPVIAEFGGELPAFLESFEPAETLPYLPDVARLEWQRTIAYHAANAEPAAISVLADLPPQDLSHAQFMLHPAASWIASDYPVASIWRTNTHDETVTPIGPEAAGETVLVTRPGLEVLVTELPHGAAVLLSRLAEGSSLNDAAGDASAATPHFDLAAALAALFASGAVHRVIVPDHLPRIRFGRNIENSGT
jgi:hypothetical protein